MNNEKIKSELLKEYPNSQIFENKIGDEISEIICEVEPTSKHSNWSMAEGVDIVLPNFLVLIGN